ncbi:hypothetical protein Vretimale_832 [Volvox reticuliferus]|uniref:Uncharacterized protein n=1 Tax=Volvox reticuliferus TaxID=1737510 RepID=A0A8J4FYQ0_9CHLO|nr:hypothetical protein Vretifemale_2243 [Volvox reticuliferus]GIL94602.1 hypothetical protein Vretimale_832 [Volvox reticuliferus]
MIDLKALKEQLKLLGHDLPDEQVVEILKEMNIDFNDKPTERSDAKESQGNPTRSEGDGKDKQGLPRGGSILDNFQGKQHSQQLPFSDTQDYSFQSYNYGYTSPGHAPAVGLSHAKLPSSGVKVRSCTSEGPKGGSGEGCGPQAASSDYSDDCYDHDSDEVDADDKPGVSRRYSAAETLKPTSAANGSVCIQPGLNRSGAAFTSDQAARCSTKGAYSAGLAHLVRGPSDMADRLGRVTLNEPVVGSTIRQSRLQAGEKLERKDMETARSGAAARSQRPGSIMTAKDQHRKPHGSRNAIPYGQDTHGPLPNGRCVKKEDVEDDTEGDVAGSDPDREPLVHRATSEDEEWMLPGGLGASGRNAQEPYAAWLSGRVGPMDNRLADALLAQGQLSPQASNRSFASRATSRCSTGSKRAAKKVDRVLRYQQLQQEWSQNRFLKQAGGTNRGTSRKPVNFHSHFASLHAAEEAERQRMLRETRARTKKELGAATEAPTSNRRDELRWQTRMRLREQT